MAKIEGITITLYDKVETGKDKFNHPIYEEVPEKIHNVLVGEPSTSDVTNALDLYGKVVAYALAIPKGDDHEWENKEVEFFGKKFKTVGFATEGIEAMLPLDWNKKVKVERHG